MTRTLAYHFKPYPKLRQDSRVGVLRPLCDSSLGLSSVLIACFGLAIVGMLYSLRAGRLYDNERS